MKVLFVTHSVDKFFYAGVASMSAFLKEAGHDAALINYDASYDDERFKREMTAHAPDIVGFSCLTYQWPKIQELARITKQSLDVPVICGGFHVSFSPEEVIHCPWIDIACKGEGDYAIVDLCNALETGGDTRNIPNLWVKEEGPGGELIIHRNDPRRLFRNMDDYPYWDREVCNFDQHLEEKASMTYQHLSNCMPLSAGRGCPYRCAYCGNQSLLNLYKGKGSYVRRRSVPSLMREIHMALDKYPHIQSLEFWDEDFFAISHSWLREFFKTYKREVGLPYMLGVRADNCTEENLEEAADSGCHLICMGVEHGDEEFRKKYLQRNMSNDKMIKAFRRARELGMERASLNIIGFPYETAELARHTLDLNRTLDPDYFHFYVYQVFPGCDLFKLCQREGFMPEFYYATYQTPEGAIKQPTFSVEELRSLWADFEAFRMDVDEKRAARQAAQQNRAVLTIS
jgi:radical SAM superfamily enzyme YgiQ (UPF0313 family)